MDFLPRSLVYNYGDGFAESNREMKIMIEELERGHGEVNKAGLKNNNYGSSENSENSDDPYFKFKEEK